MSREETIEMVVLCLIGGAMLTAPFYGFGPVLVVLTAIGVVANVNARLHCQRRPRLRLVGI